MLSLVFLSHPPPLILATLTFLYQCYGAPRHLHSFPTRRSSDLPPRRHGALAERPRAPRRVESFVDAAGMRPGRDRKSTRLNSSHTVISYAVFCLKKKKKRQALEINEGNRLSLQLKVSEKLS